MFRAGNLSASSAADIAIASKRSFACIGWPPFAGCAASRTVLPSIGSVDELLDERRELDRKLTRS